MTTERLLVLVLVLEGGVVLAGLLGLVARVAFMSLRHRRATDPLRRARELLRMATLGDGSDGQAVLALRALSVRHRLDVLLELSATIRGADLGRLRYIAAASGTVSRARRWSHSRRWWYRLRGVRLLGQLGVRQTPPTQFFDDPHPAVRAAAADSALPPVPPQVVARMLAMLDDPDVGCRFSAKAGLFRAGRDAAEQLRDYLTADLVAAPVAALEIAHPLGGPEFNAPALRLSWAADPAVRRAAATLLARITGATAGPRLLQLLEDADPTVRAAAADGLGALGHWPAGPSLARTLQDSAWIVRYAAALALRRMGPPGTMYLRKTITSGDPIAADVAQHVLALDQGPLSVASA